MKIFLVAVYITSASNGVLVSSEHVVHSGPFITEHYGLAQNPIEVTREFSFKYCQDHAIHMGSKWASEQLPMERIHGITFRCTTQSPFGSI